MVISKNAVTVDPLLFETSLSIFLQITRHYRHQLKLQVNQTNKVEILFGIYFQILEMENSTFQQKNCIVHAFLKIVETPQVFL